MGHGGLDILKLKCIRPKLKLKPAAEMMEAETEAQIAKADAEAQNNWWQRLNSND